MSTNKAHYIRATILDSLNSAQPFGIAHDQVVHGLVSSSGSILITEDNAAVEIHWLSQKNLLEFDGVGPTRRLKLSAKGLTFQNAGKPWDKLEVLD